MDHELQCQALVEKCKQEVKGGGGEAVVSTVWTVCVCIQCICTVCTAA